MKATNALTNPQEKKKSFSAVISSDSAQQLIRASLRDDGAVKRFTGTLISVVKASEQLRNCDPGSIIAAALRGEGAGLIYGQGYYVVPYKDKAGYITSYKGWCQLAIATGLYADIDVLDVREGERKGRDPRTGKPIVDMSVYDTDEERELHPIIGVKAYFLLKDGYYREEYWSMGEVLNHANRYSPAFSRDLYEKWQRGEKLTKDETYTIENGSPWYTSTMRMAKKTVLKSLLTSGFAPLSNEVKSLLNYENASGEAVIPDAAQEIIPDLPVIEPEETDSEATTASESGFDEKEVEVVDSVETPSKDAPKRGKTRKSESTASSVAEKDEYDSIFFGNGGDSL